MMPAMKDACIADRWPDALTRCIIQAKPGDLAAMTPCNALMPKDLQDKLQRRMLQLAPHRPAAAAAAAPTAATAPDAN